MPKRETTNRRAMLCGLALLAGSGIVSSCVSPSAPPPPGGGQRLVLSFTAFRDSVSPVLERHGCDADGDCHGGGIRGTLELSPASAKNLTFDYDQIVLQVYPTLRDSSPVLTRPLALAAGGSPHPFKPFADTTDPDFATVRRWVDSGVLQ